LEAIVACKTCSMGRARAHTHTHIHTHTHTHTHLFIGVPFGIINHLDADCMPAGHQPAAVDCAGNQVTNLHKAVRAR
jgi:hypothetical protein